jgi:hypothetical protein
LHEERVGNLILFSFVVFESRTVVEGHIFDDDLGGYGGLGIFLVSNFDVGRSLAVEGGFEAIASDDQTVTAEKGHDGALADSCISDEEHCLRDVLIDGDDLCAATDQFL